MPYIDSLRPGVLDLLFEIYSKKTFENKIPEFYKDRKGLRTIGVGCLVEASDRAVVEAYALKKMFVKTDPETYQPTNEAVSKPEVMKDWERAKTFALKKDKNGSPQTTRIPKPGVMLTEAGIRQLFNDKNEHDLSTLAGETGRGKERSWFQAFLEEWPADAQLGILAIAFGGPGYLDLGKQFGKVPQWCKVGRFDKAAEACRQAVWGGSDYRKLFFANCFKAAHDIQNNKMDKDTFHIRQFMAF